MVSSRESKAWRSYQLIEPDRSGQLDQLRAAARPSRRMSRRLREAARFTKLVPDLQAAYLTYLSEPVVKIALGRQSTAGQRRDPRDILFGSTIEQDVVASCEPFDDGSGLVVISDPLLALCNQLADFNVLWMRWARQHQTPGKLSAHPYAETAPEHLETLAGRGDLMAGTAALRYWTIHQRVFGTASRLGIWPTAQEERFATCSERRLSRSCLPMRRRISSSITGLAATV